MALLAWLLMVGWLSFPVDTLEDLPAPPRPRIGVQDDYPAPPKPGIKVQDDFPGPPKPRG